VTETPARDELIRYATTTRTVTVDGLDPLLDAVLAEAHASVGSAPATDRAALVEEKLEIDVPQLHFTDRATLRDRIAEALVEWTYRGKDPKYGPIRRPDTVTENAYSRADAVLSVLPASSDRAAVLNEGAARIEAMTAEAYERALSENEIGYANGLENAMRELRRMADETPQPETEPREEPGTVLARYITEQPISVVQAALRVLGWPITFELQPDEQAAVVTQPAEEADNPRTVCVCSHTRGEHLAVSGRLLCDACDPDSTDNLVCRGFDAL